MNVAAIKRPDTVEKNKSNEHSVGWFILICLIWTTLAVSDQSFWLDEAHGAGWKANQKTLSEWWNDDIAQKGSTDSQIPLYVLYIWAYAKVFGSGEWVLRAANLPWIFLGFWAWLHALPKRTSLKWSVAVVAACSPFLWYYLNEARPYAMQIGSTFLIAAALQQLYKKPSDTESRLDLAAFCFGLLLLSGSNLLGQLWAAAAVATAVFVFGWQRTKAMVRKNSLLCLTTSLILIGLGIYYLWTLKSGARATTVGKTDAKNFIFIAYELFGFNGIGPGRLDIRENGLSSFRPYVIWLVAYAIVLAPVFFAGVRYALQLVPKRISGFTLLFFGGVSAFLSLVGIFTQFRILGRHFAPLLVFVVFLLGMGISRMWSADSRVKKGWAILFVALSLVSCFSLRFAPRHGKDDYRGAAQIARAALENGKIVPARRRLLSSSHEYERQRAFRPDFCKSDAG
jgi:hypothetical protein